jgi:hypothetical protein
MCKRCAVTLCEVLVLGQRDLCSKCFGRLPQSQRDILDKHQGAAPDSPGATRYRAELAASIHVLEGIKAPVRQENNKTAGSTGPKVG